MTHKAKSNKCYRASQPRNLYQSSLWGDTYLTPEEARIYITQMLMTLKQAREKKNGKA